MRSRSLLALAAASLYSVVASAPTATADNGVFVGVATSVPGGNAPVNKWLGVPFAVTPPQRFSPPVKPANSNTVRQALNYGPGCLQQGNVFIPPIIKPLPVTPPPDSEDCLYLNVYAPTTPAPSGGRPVMFWIYGGAFTQGSSGIALFDGTYLAAKEDVVIVTFNYRTNAFGFPGAIPGLPADSVNPGLLDQKLALDWVKRNIAAFGGAPSKVTIFGESAGATSVDLMILTNTPATAQFRAAIMESGTYYLVGNGIGLLGPLNTTGGTPAQRLSAAVGCGWNSGTLACLRGKNATTLKSAEENLNLPWQPIPDNGVTVPPNNNGQKVRDLLGGARVPTVLGTNANEAEIFFLGSPGTFAYIFSQFPELAPFEAQIRASYPVGGCSVTGCWKNEFEASSQAVTDYLFTCNAAREARTQAFTLVPTWRYLYNQTQPFNPPPLNQYAFHASELPLVFDTLDPAVSTPPVTAVGQYIRDAWTTFAKNLLAGPGWKLYTSLPFLQEINQLGGPGNPNGRFDTDNTVVDAYCWIYAPIYQMRDPVF